MDKIAYKFSEEENMLLFHNNYYNFFKLTILRLYQINVRGRAHN